MHNKKLLGIVFKVNHDLNFLLSLLLFFDHDVGKSEKRSGEKLPARQITQFVLYFRIIYELGFKKINFAGKLQKIRS